MSEAAPATVAAQEPNLGMRHAIAQNQYVRGASALVAMTAAALAVKAFEPSLAHAGDMGDISGQIVDPGDLPQNLPPTVTATFKAESSTATMPVSDIASGQVTVLGNIRAGGIPKKERQRLEANGQCRTFDGNDTVIYTQGYGTGNMKEYGRDYRTSRFCRVSGRWIRELCDNGAKINVTPKHVVPGRVVFVNNLAKEKVNIHAGVVANASCEVDGASASASAVASADVRGSLRAFLKSKGSVIGGKVISKIYGSLKANAAASAVASAHCESVQATVVINGQTVEVPPKDGTPGAGNGTPGNTNPDGSGLGGPGTPNQDGSGDPNNGGLCRDPNTGAIVPGTADQQGYC